MISSIAPHSPPVTEPGDRAASDADQDTSIPFDRLLPVQSRRGTPDSDPSDEDSAERSDATGGSGRAALEKSGRRAAVASTIPDAAASVEQPPSLVDLRTIMPPLTLSPGLKPAVASPRSGEPLQTDKGVKKAAAESTIPDAAALAAQLTSLVDLRTTNPPLSLSPELKPPVASNTESAPTSADGSSLAASPATGMPATGQIGAPDAGGSPTAAGAGSIIDSAMAVPSALVVPTKAPDDVATSQTLPAATSSESALKVEVGDSRLAVSLQPLGGEAKGLAPRGGREAKTATPLRPVASSGDRSRSVTPQVRVGQQVTTDNDPAGTAIAKDVEVVNATISSKDEEVTTNVPAKRGGAVSLTTAAAIRPATSGTPGSDTILTSAVATTSPIDASTPQVAANATATDSGVARQVVRVETLLQTALSTGESIRPNGQAQMEMRVRLGGGADDVTVRMEVANDRLQVTFQTDSPELTRALQTGWQQFSTTTAQTSTLSLAAPRFESDGSGQTFQGGQSDAQNFSGQPDSRRQNPAPSFTDESLPANLPRRAPASASVSTSVDRLNRWA